MSESPSGLRLVGGSRFAVALRARRAALGITQAELARRLNIRQQTVGAWERGERPQRRFYEQLADVLDLKGPDQVEQLIEGLPLVPTRSSAASEANRPSEVEMQIRLNISRRLVAVPPPSGRELELMRLLLSPEGVTDGG